MKKFIIFVMALVLVVGCSKKPVRPTPEPEPPSENVEAVIVDETSGAESEGQLVSGQLDSEEVEEVAVVVDTDQGGSQSSIKPNLDYDQILTDSVWVDYMIKPGDYLSLIAYNEYGNANVWRDIYNWNQEMIGDDPDRIFPYNELDLKKPRNMAVEFTYEHYIHTVVGGETLWSIAQKEYGDSYAWVVLFWDNEQMINQNDGKLYPGMKLKIRTSLWPNR